MVRVSSEELDAAQQVHNLAENGGLDHAFHQAGHLFVSAADAFDAIGGSAAALVLRAFVGALDPVPMTPQQREAAMQGKDRDLEYLVRRYAELAGDIQAQIDSANAGQD